jgi:hypothetical protein
MNIANFLYFSIWEIEINITLPTNNMRLLVGSFHIVLVY